VIKINRKSLFCRIKFAIVKFQSNKILLWKSKIKTEMSHTRQSFAVTPNCHPCMESNKKTFFLTNFFFSIHEYIKNSCYKKIIYRLASPAYEK
jgi:hypothetical protein